MKYKLIVPIFFLFVIFNFCFSHAQTKDQDILVVAQGYGVDFQDALLKAKRMAVEAGIGVVLVSQTEVEAFTVKKRFCNI